MKRISCFFVLIISVLFNNKYSNAYEINDKIYTDINFSIGYAFQKTASEGMEGLSYYGYNNKFHSFILGTGINFYYKINNIHPFIGIDIEGRVPMDPGIFNDNEFETKKQWVLNDFMSFHFKFGTKFVISNKIELSVYGLIGGSLLQSASDMWSEYDADGKFVMHSAKKETYDLAFVSGEIKEDKISKIFVGISTGVGVNAIYNIKNNLSIFGAIEYQYHMVNNVDNYHHLTFYEYINEGDAEDWTKSKKVQYKAHQLSLKLGLKFS